MPLGPIDVFARVAQALEAIGAVYVVGGSLASSVHGLPRATNDIDIVADLSEQHIDALAGALREQFYIAPDVARQAVREGGSFNIIHYESAIKADIFVAGDDAFRHAQIRRREACREAGESMFVLTPEDTILAKLRWYRDGGEVSQRQWQDVVDVVQVQADRLDAEYLRQTAGTLGVADLLHTAMARCPQ